MIEWTRQWAKKMPVGVGRRVEGSWAVIGVIAEDAALGVVLPTAPRGWVLRPLLITPRPS
jgi:hypothetical protein